jgi:hypothetical protein
MNKKLEIRVQGAARYWGDVIKLVESSEESFTFQVAEKYTVVMSADEVARLIINRKQLTGVIVERAALQ